MGMRVAGLAVAAAAAGLLLVLVLPEGARAGECTLAESLSAAAVLPTTALLSWGRPLGPQVTITLRGGGAMGPVLRTTVFAAAASGLCEDTLAGLSPDTTYTAVLSDSGSVEESTTFITPRSYEWQSPVSGFFNETSRWDLDITPCAEHVRLQPALGAPSYRVEVPPQRFNVISLTIPRLSGVALSRMAALAFPNKMRVETELKARCRQVVRVGVAVLNDTALQVDWDDVVGTQADGYRVFVDANGTRTTHDAGGTATDRVVAGLPAGAEVRVWVAALLNGDPGAPSDPQTVTLQSALTLQIVPNVAVPHALFPMAVAAAISAASGVPVREEDVTTTPAGTLITVSILVNSSTVEDVFCPARSSAADLLAELRAADPATFDAVFLFYDSVEGCDACLCVDCPAGTSFEASTDRCVAIAQCPMGSLNPDGSCNAPLQCPSGSTLSGSECVVQGVLQCRAGEQLVDGACVGLCTPPNVNNVRDECVRVVDCSLISSGIVFDPDFDGADKCVDVDECLRPDACPAGTGTSCSNVVCSRGSCATPGDGFTCDCAPGFVKNSTGFCVALTSCSAGEVFDPDLPGCDCPANSGRPTTGASAGRCVPVPTCTGGFVVNPASLVCEDADECAATPDVCAAKSNSSCVNLPGDYDCACDAGFVTAFAGSNKADSTNACIRAATPADDGTGSPSSSSSVPIIPIAAAVGGLLLIAIIVAIVVVKKKRRGQRSKRAPPDQQPQMYENAMFAPPQAMPSAAAAMYEVPVVGGGGGNREIPREYVRLLEVLGEGNFGEVHRAHLLFPGEPVQVVAVKSVRPGGNEAEFRAEVALMRNLRRHPNVLSMVGHVTKGRPLLLLLEYMSLGNLRDFLRGCRATKTTQQKVALPTIQGWAVQVADGMEFLESQKIIHRDLAARNILVDSKTTMKISDFGLARDVQGENVYNKTSQGKVPYKWMAPESILYKKYTSKSDVWAWGIMAWEMLTLGATPYPGVKSAQDLIGKLERKERMSMPKTCDDTRFFDIVLTCWQQRPEDRPSFSKLKTALKPYGDKAGESADGYVNLDEDLYEQINLIDDQEGLRARGGAGVGAWAGEDQEGYLSVGDSADAAKKQGNAYEYDQSKVPDVTYNIGASSRRESEYEMAVSRTPVPGNPYAGAPRPPANGAEAGFMYETPVAHNPNYESTTHLLDLGVGAGRTAAEA